MRKPGISIMIVGMAAALVVTGCSSSKKKTATTTPPAAPASNASSSSSGGGGAVDGKGAKVGIILPDTISSPRWVTADPTALKAACTKYNLKCDIQNANGDAAKMKTIAEQMESNGVKVLMIVDLDAASGAAIEQEATKNGVIPVDYDRLTPGGGAALYVSFDNTKVGELQGTALTQCPQVKGKKAVKFVEIDGAATDNNATLFHNGYDGVLKKTAGWTMVDRQNGNWDAPTAGREFNSMLSAHPDINAVMVANDTMAGAVITDLQNQHLNGQVAVSGQDATAQGLQHIMDGDQCFTIYKPSVGEADPAVQAIAQLANKQVPDTKGVTIEDPKTHKAVPSILATPTVITKANVAQPINDQYTPKATGCKGAYVAKCTAAGVK
jgi:D-xylose transport system substrate-binding protein